jgi:short-subunit dehydrogenase
MKDKVIVITGGSAGIGAALATTAVARGAKVVIAARRKPELDALVGKLGSNAFAVVTDVTKRSDNDQLRDRAIEKFGHIDVWVANAGRGLSRPVSQLTDADVDEMMTVNVKSVLYSIQAPLDHWKTRKAGHIIAVSSGLSRLPLAAFRSAYSASKAAVNLLMASLRLELRAEFPGIHVSTIIPGVVATQFGANALHGGVDSRAIPNAQPVEEVADVICGVIEKPRAEVYTRPQMLELAARYFSAEDVAVIENQPPFTTPPGSPGARGV